MTFATLIRLCTILLTLIGSSAIGWTGEPPPVEMSPAVGAPEQPFHALHWDMTEAEVIATMPGTPGIPDALQGDLWQGIAADLTYVREEYGFLCHVECNFNAEDRLAEVTLRFNTEVIGSRLDGKSEGTIGEALKALYGPPLSRQRNDSGAMETIWETPTSRLTMLYMDAGVATAPVRIITLAFVPLPAKGKATSKPQERALP